MLIYSLASRLNGYMYSNGTSLNLALLILMANHLAWCILAKAEKPLILATVMSSIPVLQI